MRYQRLTLESGSNAVTVRFHPRLTVIAGVGRLERESLMAELVGALAGTRRGVHLEILEDNGRRLAILRSPEGPDRVLDLHTQRDVTDQHAVDGVVDFVSKLTRSPRDLQKLSRLSGEDVLALGASDNLIASLAGVDQDTLWSAADAVLTTKELLRQEVEPVGATTDDAIVIAEIERRHALCEKALQHHETLRHYGMFVGIATVLGAIPAALMNRYSALPFLGVAMAFTVLSIVSRRRLDNARIAEDEALVKAGAQSYMGFHLQRMNEIVSEQSDRQRVSDAAAVHQSALDAWHTVAGEIGVEWAWENRNRIRQASDRLARLQAAGVMATADDVSKTLEPAALGQAIIEKLTSLRRSNIEESIPMICDEPFVGLDLAVKEWVLDLMAQAAGSPQLVFLTNDPDVAAWARRRIVTSGDLSMIEPAPQRMMGSFAPGITVFS